MTERRYSEEEVGAIFELATKAQAGGKRQIGSGDGMTLAGLQEIAKEIGVPPELVAQAALSLDTVGRETTESIVGLPLGVGNSVELGRTMTDAEWDQFVGTLRDTFNAKGHLKTEGNFHSWTNSRLQVLLEPSPTGHRIRFRTFNTTSAGYLGIGAMLLVVVAVMAIAMGASIGFTNPRKVMGLEFIGLMGALSVAWGALRLPRWARRRREQFKELVERLAAPQK
jgi:hypothetical protein